MVKRKSLADICWNVTESVYRADSAYSYSTISKFMREGFEKLPSLFDKTTSPALTFGSIVDCLLTDGEEAFNERFFVGTFTAPPQDMIPLVQLIKDEQGGIHKSLSTLSDKEIVEYLDRLGLYQNNWYASTKANKVRDACNTYYQMLLLSEGKEVVSSEMVQDARDCVDALRNSPATKWYFQKDNPWDGIERLYQLKFKGIYNNIPLRSMMDLCIVDHNRKTIQPCDLKTTGHKEYDFYKSYITWSYNVQQNLYSELLRQLIEKDEYFKDFTILPYRFLVINRYERNPKVWQVPEDLYNKIGTVIIGTTEFRDWRDIVTELDYYLKVQPKSPKGIKEDEPNDLGTWIKQL